MPALAPVDKRASLATVVGKLCFTLRISACASRGISYNYVAMVMIEKTRKALPTKALTCC